MYLFLKLFLLHQENYSLFFDIAKKYQCINYIKDKSKIIVNEKEISILEIVNLL